MIIPTAERLAKLEQKVTDIDKKLDNHTLEQRQDFDKVFEKLDNLSGKFAGKWTEKVIIGTIIIILGFILTQRFIF